MTLCDDTLMSGDAFIKKTFDELLESLQKEGSDKETLVKKAEADIKDWYYRTTRVGYGAPEITHSADFF